MRGKIPAIAIVTILICAPACTIYGEHPARSLAEATGGEGLERVFWKNVQAANRVEIERSLASNYSETNSTETLDRDAALARYRSWRLQSFSIGDLKTELNGNTVVVTYSITLNGAISDAAGASQPLPATPLRMMTVWQQQKSGWIAIAHSVSGNVNQSASQSLNQRASR